MKPSLYASLASVFLALIASPCRADTNDIRASDRALEVDFGGSKLNYAETIAGSTFDTESGWMPSFALGATWLSSPNSSFLSDTYISGELQGTLGTTSYKGGLQDLSNGTVTPYSSKTNDQIYHLSGRIGHFFTLTDGLTLTPYFDLGYRGWTRALTGTGAITEYYEHGEGMAGFLLQVSPLQRLVFSVSGDVGTTFGAKMSTQGTIYDLGSQPVWQLQGKMGVMLSPAWELTTTARLDGFGYGASPEVNGANEPDSYTHQLTVMGGLAYHLR